MGGSCSCLSWRWIFAIPPFSSPPFDDFAIVGETLERERWKCAIPTSSAVCDDDALVVEIVERESLMERVEERIECSKSHWSILSEFKLDVDEVAEESNAELFRALQSHPDWGGFFITFGKGGRGDLVIGGKFAEGGQAELYDVEVHWNSQERQEEDLMKGTKWALKVFKKGTCLRQLQSQWPQGLLHDYVARRELARQGFFPSLRSKCDVYRGVLLEDGRFAFLMVKEDEDLRTVIDHLMLRRRENCCPFPMDYAQVLMYRVAEGVAELHKLGIIHRDLKASNVLIGFLEVGQSVDVADYECSVGIVGTGFFRAPEILQACKDRVVNEKAELFTKEADAYSYGMLCYEILTGKLPFEDYEWYDFGHVLVGERPRLPEYVEGWLQKLLMRCWLPNPIDRPCFGEILEIF